MTGIGRGHDCPGTTKTSTGKTRVGNRKKKERKGKKNKNCSMPALIWWPHEISGDNNGEWGYHVRTSVETRLDTAPTHFLQNLGHDTWWATGSV